MLSIALAWPTTTCNPSAALILPLHAANADNQTFMPLLPNDHLLFSAHAPDSVSMRITQAPAEVSHRVTGRRPMKKHHFLHSETNHHALPQFTVPVKQDKRLSPSFKVKVDVK